MTRVPPPVEILILGAGWTSTFLIPLLQQRSITFAATTTTGRDGTIPFKFDSTSDSTDVYKTLPFAKTVLITFPLNGKGPSVQLTKLYRKVHGDDSRWIQLGSTRGFNQESWNDDSTPYDPKNERGQAEAELLSIFPTQSTVLNLAGLYGGSRVPKNWLTRVVQSKDALKDKGALHLVHGEDVALAITAVHGKFEAVAGKRWIVADLHCYDWWDLILAWAPDISAKIEKEQGETVARELDYEKWVWELMDEMDVRALPRPLESMGRLLNSRGFWRAVGVLPGRPNVLTSPEA